RRAALRDAEFEFAAASPMPATGMLGDFKESKLRSANQFMRFDDERKFVEGSGVVESKGELPSLATRRVVSDAIFKQDKAEEAFMRAASRSSDGPRMYGRPSFSQDDRVFYDLVSYLPGMNTTQADIEAALENEASPKLSNIRGSIDPAARA